MPTQSSGYLSSDQRRTQLLELGMQLFGSQGYDAVSIGDIAREAEISKGLMYHYFGGKRALFLEVIRYASAELLEVLSPDPSLGQLDNLKRGLTAYFEFVDARGNAYQALILGGQGEDVQRIVEESRNAFIDNILLGVGTSLPAPRPWRSAVRLWIGSVEAAALDYIHHQNPPPSQLISMLTASLAGLLLVAQSHAPLPDVTLDIPGALAWLMA